VSLASLFGLFLSKYCVRKLHVTSMEYIHVLGIQFFQCDFCRICFLLNTYLLILIHIFKRKQQYLVRIKKPQKANTMSVPCQSTIF